MAAKSIGAQIDEHGGIGVGFDLVRLVLASFVIIYHSIEVVGATVPFSHWQLLAESIVPAFFVLSGFLVTGSALRSDILHFAINRVCRIIPALAAVVVLSVLVLGPWLTTFDLRSYFSDPQTGSYFFALLGLSQMELPGVFVGMPVDQTFNVSLWTVGWEMLCYGIVAVLLITRLLPKPSFLVALLASIMAFRLGLYIAQPDVIHLTHSQLGPYVAPGLSLKEIPVDHSLTEWSADWITNRVALHLTSWEFRVIPFFLAGVLCCLQQYELRRSRWLALASFAALILATLAFPGRSSTPVTTWLTIAPIAYLVVYSGTSNLPLPRVLNGDYSYGIYLWGFPIQQTIHLFRLDNGSPWLNILLSLPLALMAGWASWHLVERPVLAKRRFMISRFRKKPAVAISA